jgi:mono/diheme cytochrome c family protein
MWLVSQGCADVEGDLPNEYRRLEVPEVQLVSRDVQRRGRALFLEHCALCHGERGDGRGQRREGLTGLPRDFTSPGWRHGTTPRRVFFAIREGRAGTSMPGWGTLNEEEAWSLTAYVLSLGQPQ